MKFAIRTIERALEDLYQIGAGVRAEDFLHPGNAKQAGTLLVLDERESADTLSLSLYFSKETKQTVSSFKKWPKSDWSQEQLSAFSVVTEEISHFHYLLFHVNRGRSVSQFEMELQAEVDKFLVTFYALNGLRTGSESAFDHLFESLFFRFRLLENLSMEQRQRYEEANQMARQFILKLRSQLRDQTASPHALVSLRKFYRLSTSEKLSRIAK